jgi:hypothetical protein
VFGVAAAEDVVGEGEVTVPVADPVADVVALELLATAGAVVAVVGVVGLVVAVGIAGVVRPGTWAGSLTATAFCTGVELVGLATATPVTLGLGAGLISMSSSILGGVAVTWKQ